MWEGAEGGGRGSGAAEDGCETGELDANKVVDDGEVTWSVWPVGAAARGGVQATDGGAREGNIHVSMEEGGEVVVEDLCTDIEKSSSTNRTWREV